MTIPSFSWLHLTDFHFGLKDQDCLWPTLRQAFLEDLDSLHDLTGPWDAVLFTGDLVQAGRSSEFVEMQRQVLDRLWEKLNELGSGNAVLLAVPGNHDLFRPDPKDDNAAVDKMLEKDSFKDIEGKFWNNSLGSYRRVVNEAFSAYSDWWQSSPYRPKNITSGMLPGDFSHSIKVGTSHHVGIIGLNTAFYHLGGGDYKEKLVWNVRQLHAACGSPVDDWLAQNSLCLLLTHHGPEWLTPEARLHGETEIAPAGRFALHLYGHMHETSIRYIRQGGAVAATRLCQGSSAFGMEKFGDPPAISRQHGYAAGRIEFGHEQATLRIWPRIATNTTGPWRFIPDYQHGHLENDQGTSAEVIQTVQLKPARVTTHRRNEISTPNPGSTPFVAPHSTLPSRRPFFGREKELNDIARFLQPEYKGWGVVLDGPGGMGKTSLALEAAHLAPAEHFSLKLFITAKTSRLDPDGVHELHDNRVDNYFSLLSEIAIALGHTEIQQALPEHRAEFVRHALSAQKVLLVLDNLETFTREERRRIYDLLEVLPGGCRAIVTSRRRDETAARTIRLDKLDFEAAQKMLAGLGERTHAIAQLSIDEQRTLYSETGGNPLLLTWVAAQLGRAQGRCRTVAEAVQRLHQAHIQQKANEKNDPLEFVFGDLLDTFTDDETAVLAALSQFSESARLSWLLPLAELSMTAALTALDDLRDRALLIEDQSSNTWFLPPLCARFLRLRRPEAVRVAALRLEAEAFALVMQHGGENKDSYGELEAVWPSIQAAIPSLIAGDNTRLQAICDNLNTFLYFTGRRDIHLALSLQAEAKAISSNDFENAGWRAYQAGWVYQLQGNAEAVLECSKRCGEYWHKADTGPMVTAVALRLRAIGYALQKNYAASIIDWQETLELSKSLAPDTVDVANDLNGLAAAKEYSGDLAGAEADYREALRISLNISNDNAAATVLCNLAGLHLIRKDWRGAQRAAEEALSISKSLGRLDLIADNNRILATALLGQNKHVAALPNALEAVQIYAQLGAPELPIAQALLQACSTAGTA